jgi:ER membrane protein complex subunit 2
MTDNEAYLELSDLYLSVFDFNNAIFCVEELILLNPFNYLYHLKLADILYTKGDKSLAKKYYSQSLNLNISIRGLFGLLLVKKFLLFIKIFSV